MRITLLFLAWLIVFDVAGQTITYNDVVVIVNKNSETSIEIGNYFQAARNIPNINIIQINAPTTEEIDSLQFVAIRAEIENYLIVNGLVDSINYLVTTKGVPLKIESNCFSPYITDKACASFDSELTLILGAYANQIGLGGSLANPVYNTTENFSRANSGIYLVTRLDAYTRQDVFNLIDRSGPFTGINKESAQAIVDLNNAVTGDSAYFMDFYLQPTYDFLVDNSWNAQLDTDFNPLVNQSNVFSYTYQGHGPISNVALNYNWTEGSISSMSSCKSATTFDAAMNSNNYFLIANLISEGCTGAQGHVDCFFFGQILNSEILMSRYLDPVVNYNLAESFYMAELRLSWQTVIVGDPKASVFIDNLATIQEENNIEIKIYPNPSTGNIKISGSDMINSISVFDMKGAKVKYLDQINSENVEVDLNAVGDGMYLIQVDMGTNSIRERIVINK